MTYDAQERLADYQETMDNLRLWRDELKKLDLDALYEAKKHLQRTCLDNGYRAILALIDDVKEEMHDTNHCVTIAREEIRFTQVLEREAERRGYEASV